MTACVVCGEPLIAGSGIVGNRRKANGLPPTVEVCEGCYTSVTRRNLGISLHVDGTLSIYGTDGKGQHWYGDAQPEQVQRP